MNKLTFKPFKNYLLIQPLGKYELAGEEPTVLLPEEKEELYVAARVLSCGNACKDMYWADHLHTEMEIVVVPSHMIEVVKLGTQEFKIVQEQYVVGKATKETE